MKIKRSREVCIVCWIRFVTPGFSHTPPYVPRFPFLFSTDTTNKMYSWRDCLLGPNHQSTVLKYVSRVYTWHVWAVIFQSSVSCGSDRTDTLLLFSSLLQRPCNVLRFTRQVYFFCFTCRKTWVTNLSLPCPNASRVDMVLLSWWALLLRTLHPVFSNGYFFHG